MSKPIIPHGNKIKMLTISNPSPVYIILPNHKNDILN